MREIVRESLVLHNDEARILLRSQGILEFYGFSLGEGTLEASRAALCLQRMVQRELLACSGEVLVPNGILDCFLKAVRYGKTVISVRSRRNLPNLCVYFYKGQCIITEPFSVETNHIKISLQRMEDLLFRMEEEGYYPGTYLLTDRECAYAGETLEVLVSGNGQSPQEDCGDSAGLLEVMEIQIYRSSEHRVTEHIALYEKAMYLFLEIAGSGQKNWEIFSAERMRELLTAAGGETNDIS